MINCPVCDSSETEIISANKDTKYYRLCRNCKTNYLDDNSLLDSTIYNEEYMERNKYNDNLTLAYGRIFNRYFDSIMFNINKINNLSLLEVGFSNIGVLVEAKNKGWTSTGLDIFIPNEIKEKLNSLNIYWLEENYLNYHSNSKYDLIWMGNFIEHFNVNDAKTIITKSLEMLNENGVIYISSPDASLLWNQYADLAMSQFKPKEHITIYNTETFESIARECGAKRLFQDFFHNTTQNEIWHTRGEWRMCLAKG